MSKMATDSPHHKEMKRRVPKPLMEKRRRDRINHSLETLRLLLLENTCNEKLKNPKVEKAEILESVVHFLQAEQRSRSFSYPVKRDRGFDAEFTKEMESPCKRQQHYNDGMRTCLLRVSHFFEDQEVKGNIQYPFSKFQDDQTATNIHLRQEVISISGQKALTPVESTDSCTILGQSLHTKSTEVPESAFKTSSVSKQPLLLNDSVWRPWPY